MIKRTVSAFTIMELTVTMMITAIAMTIVFTAYLIVSRSYNGFEKKHRQVADLELLDHWLHNDVNKSISLKSDSGNLLTLRTVEQTIRYRFQREGIIRTAARTDTFKFELDSLRFAFEGHSLAENPNDSTTNIADEVSFLLKADSTKIPFRYHKQYSSEELVNLMPHASN